VKTIIRIGDTMAQLAPLGVAMLADAYDKRRKDLSEATLMVYETPGGPVYVIVSPRPPELLPGDRRVWAVFAPVDSQEPLATFFEKSVAERWATREYTAEADYRIEEIDATDRVAIRACVAVVVKNADDQVLYCRHKRTKQWSIPEGDLQIGETGEAAARRCVRSIFDAEIGPVMLPQRVPYINVYLPEAGHYLALVLVAQIVDADVAFTIKSDIYDAWQWGSAKEPPNPQFVTVRAIRQVLEVTEPPPPVAAVAKSSTKLHKSKTSRKR